MKEWTWFQTPETSEEVHAYHIDIIQTEETTCYAL